MLVTANTSAVVSKCGTSNSLSFAKAVSTTPIAAASATNHAAIAQSVPPGKSIAARIKKLSWRICAAACTSASCQPEYSSARPSCIIVNS